MRLFVLSAVAAALAMVAPGAGAAQEFGTKETRRLMHAYAKCVVKGQSRKASEAVLRNVNNSTIIRDYPRLLNGECLADAGGEGVQMSFAGDLYRYALADALVNRELVAFQSSDFSAVPPLEHRDPGEAPSLTDAKGRKVPRKKHEEAVKGHREDVAFFYLSRYGECVVRSAPAYSKALLMTAPDSTEETAQFGSLRSALSRCLPAGETLRFGRVALRGTIAINYFRLASAFRAAPTGTAE